MKPTTTISTQWRLISDIWECFSHVRQVKAGENSELLSVGGGVQTTDACGNADMCSLSGLCPSLPAHTDVLKTLNLVLLPSFIYFLTMSGRYTDFSTLWGFVKTFWGAAHLLSQSLFWNHLSVFVTVNNVQQPTGGFIYTFFYTYIFFFRAFLCLLL